MAQVKEINLGDLPVNIEYQGTGPSRFITAMQKMIKKKEFSNLVQRVIEKHGSITYRLVNKDGRASRQKKEIITIDLNHARIAYEVNVDGWDGWKDKLDHLQGDQYWNAIDKYVDENQYHIMSLPRHIYHETYHAAMQSDSGLKYELNRNSYEREAIEATNKFMWRHFQEPHRVKRHGAWKVIK